VRSPRDGVTLADYYFADPRVVLIPPEHLSTGGMSAAFAEQLAARRGWRREQVALFDAAFALYWTRSAGLARRLRAWPAPRRRHVALVADALAVRPYVQLLNTSAWLLYEMDFDPAASDPEFAAYLLVHGDGMAASGEVTMAALRTAAWWLERTDRECAAFAAAAARSRRPDAPAFQALAAATAWLRRLAHETLRPPPAPGGHRAIPGTGLLVPGQLEERPPALVARWRSAATDAVAAYRAAWRAPPARAAADLAAWLAAEAPPLLVTAAGGRILWDPDAPAAVEGLGAALRDADAVAVEAIAEDLRLIAAHTRAFLAALVDPSALPAPPATTMETGYSFLHPRRRLIAYNLHEPGMERLHGPPLPYARAMLGARTWHEWGHLADTAGWVPRRVSRERFAEAKAALAAGLEETVARAPDPVRAGAAADLADLAGGKPAGAALVALLLTRMPDYRANLVARRFMSLAERETYVRHNVRTLRPEYPPARIWRMLVRYLYEYQYLGPALGLTAIADPLGWFVDGTWFDQDFVASGVLDPERFEALARAVGEICACYEVDGSRFRFPSG
jgi:hypothetical protein